MKVTEVRITKLNNTGDLKGFASICLDGEFVVDGYKIINRDGELRVLNPDKSKKNADGTFEHRDTAYATSPELKAKIIAAIKEEYSK